MSEKPSCSTKSSHLFPCWLSGAIRLGPDSPEAHQLRGALCMGPACRDLETAALEFAVALDLARDGHTELAPTLHAQLAVAKYHLGERGEDPRTPHPPSCGP